MNELPARWPYRDASGAVLFEVSAHAEDRQELALFAEAVKARTGARRDEYGSYCLLGKIGQVYATGVRGAREFQLIVGAAPDGEISARRWSSIKKRLSFCTLSLDGQSEGRFTLGRLPTADEASIIRKALGLPKAFEVSEGERHRRREWGRINGRSKVLKSAKPMSSLPLPQKTTSQEKSTQTPICATAPYRGF